MTIKNIGLTAAGGLVFKDTIDASVIPSTGNEFVVTASSGTIKQKTLPIEVDGINIAAGGTVTIIIAGKIA